jgi:hypothetical protein
VGDPLMPWYAWVIGPVEFAVAFMVFYPQLWKKAVEWFDDFHDYRPSGPVLTQVATAQRWQQNRCVDCGLLHNLSTDRCARCVGQALPAKIRAYQTAYSIRAIDDDGIWVTHKRSRMLESAGREHSHWWIKEELK